MTEDDTEIADTPFQNKTPPSKPHKSTNHNIPKVTNASKRRLLRNIVCRWRERERPVGRLYTIGTGERRMQQMDRAGV